MTKSKETTSPKSQTGLMAQVIALHNKIMGLRQSGKLITQEQNQLRERLKKIS
jgi:hypothetical protein